MTRIIKIPKLKNISLCFHVYKNNNIMKVSIKSKEPDKKANDIRKPEGTPKVIFGGGKNFGYMSDTLFDEDLKR